MCDWDRKQNDFENMSFNEILSDFGPETFNHKEIQRKVVMSDVFLDHYKNVLNKCNVQKKWKASNLPKPPTFPEDEKKQVGKIEEIQTMGKIIETLASWENNFCYKDLPFPSKYISTRSHVDEFILLFMQRFVE